MYFGRGVTQTHKHKNHSTYRINWSKAETSERVKKIIFKWMVHLKKNFFNMFEMPIDILEMHF